MMNHNFNNFARQGNSTGAMCGDSTWSRFFYLTNYPSSPNVLRPYSGKGQPQDLLLGASASGNYKTLENYSERKCNDGGSNHRYSAVTHSAKTIQNSNQPHGRYAELENVSVDFNQRGMGMSYAVNASSYRTSGLRIARKAISNALKDCPQIVGIGCQREQSSPQCVDLAT